MSSMVAGTMGYSPPGPEKAVQGHTEKEAHTLKQEERMNINAYGEVATLEHILRE